MKLSICGKGGCGKSTISALIARNMKKMGYQVLLVDADESNFGLHRLLGTRLPENVMDCLGGKKGFQEKMAGLKQAPEGSGLSLFNGKWSIGLVPDEYLARNDNISLMLVGKIHSFAEGCACPMGALAKIILANLEPKEKEIVIVDTEAGTEHFGRGIEGECDMILVVVDPTYESFLLAGKMEEMGRMAGRPVFFLLNKANPEIEEMMTSHLNSEKIIGRIPADTDLFTASLKGIPLMKELTEVEKICKFLITTWEKTKNK